MTRITLTDVEAAVLGGAVLGGGGGGSLENGRALGRLALERGAVELVDLADIPEDSTLVTCSYVGSPAAEHICVRPEAYIRALHMLQEGCGVRAEGLITNECGGTAAVNGWLQAATLVLPVVDAPCNGRAHPTGVMGSMGLHALPGYVSHQAAAGGDAAAGRYVELLVSGGLEAASALVRQGALQAGGMVAAARNPVTAGYVSTHGAPGAIRQCIALGQVMLATQPQGGEAICRAAAQYLGGEIAAVETVHNVNLRSTGGFDVGVVQAGAYTLDFWNEYMTLECAGERLATFPDLIMTLDAVYGMPVTTAQVQVGQQLALLVVPRERLLLGAGMFYDELYLPAEQALGKRIRNMGGDER